MRRFSASAGGNPQSTKTFSLPFVARITCAFPAIHGSVSFPTQRQVRYLPGLLGEDMQHIRPTRITSRPLTGKMWRTHFCVPRQALLPTPAATGRRSVEWRLDAARKSACATVAWGNRRRRSRLSPSHWIGFAPLLTHYDYTEFL